MTIYKLVFHKAAMREWKKLSNPIKEQFKRKLKERIENPFVDSSALRGMKNCYKIKLRTVGYRLVYEVHQDRLIIHVILVGKRDGKIYQKANNRKNPN